MIQISIFILCSILLLVFTLSRPHRHRFPRYFAFISIIGLVLLNADNWFWEPLSLRQIISWILLTSSLILVIHGFRLLRIVGSPGNDIEDTTQLVTTGAYRYIRHPIYCSLLSGGAGVFLKEISLPSILLLLVSFIFVFITAKAEESDNLEKFGEEYRAYMNTTKMFIPYLI
ncbi:MAG: isoprenylcysteine carboxylmethyltransferase family protein [Fidelibacterota bacterium]|nr:MAG: isoprenylcysteine carboxylmethyltransferase family protein [Candidatus Neomarinimicrobiota bacterium]